MEFFWIILFAGGFNPLVKGISPSNNHITNLMLKISNGQDISWNEFSTLKGKDFDLPELNQIIDEGISKELFFGKLLKNVVRFDALEKISIKSLEYFNAFTSDLEMNDYNFVEVTRSSVRSIRPGLYVYSFNESEDLMLLRAPFNVITFVDAPQLCFTVFDKQEIEKAVHIIEREKMKDFQYFGNQLMQTDLSITTAKPGFGTVLAEFALGTSYSLMKGISKIALNSTHTIQDARVVQIILKDKTDIELKGISIYYELNRRMGNVKNKDLSENENETIYENSISNNESFKSETLSANLDYINELRQLKELLDEGILNQEEYDSKKKKILNL